MTDKQKIACYKAKINRLNEEIAELNKSYKELSQERDFQISKQENFAKQQGFTPDATPYYIALQYKRRAEAAEARLKELQEGKK